MRTHFMRSVSNHLAWRSTGWILLWRLIATLPCANAVPAPLGESTRSASDEDAPYQQGCDQESCSGHGACMSGGICHCDPSWSGRNCDFFLGATSATEGEESSSSAGHAASSFAFLLRDRVERASKTAMQAAEDFFSEAGRLVAERTKENNRHTQEDAHRRIRAAVEEARSEASKAGLNVDLPGSAGEVAPADLEFIDKLHRLARSLNSSCQTAGSVCSGHGICNQTTGTCDCDAGYVGNLCDTAICGLNCSERGMCISGECVCDEQFMGQFCEYSRCPADCSQHGYCFEGVCMCDEGFDGDDCANETRLGSIITFKLPQAWPRLRGYGDQGASTLRTSSEKTCEKGCGTHGSCDDGTCVCSQGFSGPNCDTFCPNGCSGRGMCINGGCLCNAGWSEADCSKVIACGGHGQVHESGCSCDPGWTGRECLIEMVCPGDGQCGGKGICDKGTCICGLGFTGPTCTQLAADVQCTGTNCTSNIVNTVVLTEAERGHVVYTGAAGRGNGGSSPHLAGDASLAFRRSHVTPNANVVAPMGLAEGSVSVAVNAAKELAASGKDALQAAHDWWAPKAGSVAAASASSAATAAQSAEVEAKAGATTAGQPRPKRSAMPLTAQWIKESKAGTSPAMPPAASRPMTGGAAVLAEVEVHENISLPSVHVAQPSNASAGLLSLLNVESGVASSTAATRNAEEFVGSRDVPTRTVDVEDTQRTTNQRLRLQKPPGEARRQHARALKALLKAASEARDH